MRKLLAILTLTVIAGCNWKPMAQAPQEPNRVDLTQVLVQDSSAPACKGQTLVDPPVLSGITAYGLEGDLHWSPGRGYKVNWVGNKLDQPITVSLQKEAADAQIYTLQLLPRPSLIGFPGPGCWKMSVEQSGTTESTILKVEVDSPIALTAPGQGDSSSESGIQDLFKALSTGNLQDIPEDRKGYPFSIAWKSGWAEPLFLMPSVSGKEPLIVVRKAFLTGSCQGSGGYKAVAITPGLARVLTDTLHFGESGPVSFEMPTMAGCLGFSPSGAQ